MTILFAVANDSYFLPYCLISYMQNGSRIFRRGTFCRKDLIAVGQFAVGQITLDTPKNIQGLDIFFRIGGP